MAAKKQSMSHAIDADGQALLASKLPRSWKLREYRPDYGLDYALELFEDFPDIPRPQDTVETLGEHIFIQLKTKANPQHGPCPVFGRHNVEKSREALNRKDHVGTLDTYRLPVDTPELVTVERMGIAVPVLLVVADLARQQCAFVCLNDYIDKILVPRFGNYASAASRTIHIPLLNAVGSEHGNAGLRWYAKRAKLIAAFQRFGFQNNELGYAHEDEWRALALYFANRIARYDIWSDLPMWPIVTYLGNALKRFLETGQPGLMSDVTPPSFKDEFAYYNRKQDVLELWRMLENLSRIYEDIAREWYLPTGVGFTGSYEVNFEGELGSTGADSA